MSKPKWDTLTRSKKALPRVWDSLTPELRRKLFVGNTFTSFKLWRKLAPKEVKVITEKLHYKKDVEKICKQLQKFLVKQEKENQSIEENNMSSKTKNSKKTSTSKATKPTTKTEKKSSSKSTSKVVGIYDKVVKTVDCPKCGVKKGHRCIYTLNNKIKKVKKGDKRSKPHTVRIAKLSKSSKKAA